MRFGTLVVLVFALVACGTSESSAPGVTQTTMGSETTTSVTVTVTSMVPETGGTATTVVETTTTDPYTFEIALDGSTVTGGGRITVPLGVTVTLRIDSDVTDEVHIHGYDLFVDLVAGETAEVSFVADIPGVVEIETHDTGLVLANLEAS